MAGAGERLRASAHLDRDLEPSGGSERARCPGRGRDGRSKSMAAIIDVVGNEKVTGPGLTSDQLAARFYGHVRRFAETLAPNVAEADDLAQEAMVRALRGVEGYRSARGPLEGWLWAIVLNCARDRGRAVKRWDRLFERLTRNTQESIDIEAVALDKLQHHEIRLEVARLNERDRTFLAMRFGAELSVGEIAGLLKMKDEAVRKAVRRALGRLARQLEDRSDCI